MLITFEVLQDFLGTIALLGLLAVAYGTLTRAFKSVAIGQAILGALFGGAAVLAMVDPLRIPGGVIVDLRTMPVVLAGAFLGLPGAAVTTLIAVATRVGIGGVGAVAGSVSIVLSALVGLAWARHVKRAPGREVRNVLLLSVVSQLSMVTYFMLPWDLAWRVVTTIVPVLVPIKVVGMLVVGAMLERERMIANEVRRLGVAATQDPLTGLLNRRGLQAEAARLPRGPHGAALLVLDIDHFKRLNDQHGHAAGDAVLQSLAARLGHAARPGSLVARVGGEEVVVFLPNASRQDAAEAAERLCEVVRVWAFLLPDGRYADVTASVGVAWTDRMVRLDALVAQADAALYAAKSAGRDCWRFDMGLHLVDHAGHTVEVAAPVKARA